MRLRRLSFVAGWAAVGLLATLGFAAFGASSGQTENLSAASAGATIGHATGAYAGLTFAILGSSPSVSIEGLDSNSVVADEVLGVSILGEPDNSEQPSIDTSIPGSWLSQVEVRELISQYFAPTDVNTAVRVAWCESRFNPQSLDLRTGAAGLFKHLPRYWPDRTAAAGFRNADLTDPEASVAAAAWVVYNGGGWDVFTCRG